MHVLEEYRSIQAEIRRIERKIDELEALVTVPRISALTGMPRGGKRADFSDVVTKIEDLKTMYYAKLGRLLEIQAEAERLLEQMGSEERLIIGYKYIDGLSNMDISQRVKYSQSTIKRRIKNAMKKINEREVSNGKGN